MRGAALAALLRGWTTKPHKSPPHCAAGCTESKVNTTPTQKPDALRLAESLHELDAQFSYPGLCGESAAELLRQHAEIERLKAAYIGAQEDIAIWKRRALEAEEKFRSESTVSARFASELNAENGPTHMGEPALQRQPLTAEQIWSSEKIMTVNADADLRMETIIRFFRATEAEHGIGEKP